MSRSILHLTDTVLKDKFVYGAVISVLQVDTGIPLGMQSSMSLTCTLKSVGEMTPPWGTPAITSPCLERTPGSLRGSLPKSGPLDFATKNTFPLFFVGEEALVGVY